MSRPSTVDVVVRFGAVLLLAFSDYFCSAHVALTFPPARKYDLDFLDNLRTPGPCGMPKGPLKTTVLAGSSINVTWHLAYPHRGGYKLELLNDEGKPWMDLTPTGEGSDFVQLDATAQNHLIQLPNKLSCKGCSIRLKREAVEWANNYTFWSCADIDIVHGDAYHEDCSNHGMYKNGVCTCNKLYSGRRCQYKDECWEDKDCGSHGQCIDIDATTYPKKQCYCQLGWFGQQCNKESVIKSIDLDLSTHQKKDLSSNFKLFWKIYSDTGEIEIVMQVKSTTYVALGWRPKGLSSSCKAFPPIGESLSRSADDSPEPEPEAEAEPEPEAEPVNKDDKSRNLSETLEFVVHKGNVTEVELEPDAVSEGAYPEPEAITPNFEPVSGRASADRNTHNETADSALEHADEDTGNTHAMAESNPHPVTLEVMAQPVDVSSVPEKETGAGSVEVADQGEVNYGVEHADDGLVEYTHLLYTTPSATKAKRHKRQAKKLNLSAAASISTRSPNSSTPLPKPVEEPSPSSAAEPSAEPSAEPKPAADPTSSPTSEATSRPVAEPTPRPTAERTSKPIAEPTARPTTEPVPKPVAESSSEPIAEPTSKPAEEALAEPTSEPVPEPIPDAMENSNATYTIRQSKSRKDNELAKPEPEAEPESEPEPSAEPSTHDEPVLTYPRGPYTPKGDYHAMDCTDIVTGMARGTFSRILDMYTRDRSTPRVDSFWGGEDSLTAASGFEKDGITTIVFRRKLKTNDVTDHAIQNGPMHVIWAQGQEPGSYVHSPPSGLEKGKAGIPDFYRKDELKYHGHRDQRGVTSIDFLHEPKEAQKSHLRGEWKMPKTCTINDCEYRATWELIPAKDSIVFIISSNNSDKWTGIGFSEDAKMPHTDAILGWVDDAGRTFVMDTWIDQYGPPILDENQNIDEIKGSKINGRVTLSFVRKRNTGDSKNDLAFTDTSCLYLVFPYDGGVFNAVNKKIRKHNSVPAVSDTKICIDGTGKMETIGLSNLPPIITSVTDLIPTTTWTPSTTSSVSEKPAWMYLVAIRLPNQTLDDAIERGIDLEMLIRERLTRYMNNVLHSIHGFKKVEVTNLESEKNESDVVAKMQVFVDRHGSQRTPQTDNATVREITSTLNATIAKGKVGSLLVDPAYLVVKLPEVEEVPAVSDGNLPGSEDDNVLLAKNNENLLFVIIAAAIAFGILLFVQIICMICRWRAIKKTRVSKERLIAGAGWKDYAGSGGAGGYGYEHFGASNEETPKISKHPVGSSNGTSRSLGQANPANGGDKSGNLHPGETRSLNRNARAMESDRNNHYSRRSESLPRPNGSSANYGPPERDSRPSSAASHHPQGGLQPDFYFMPSQRRYSGEVVRVYVDYNNPNYTGK